MNPQRHQHHNAEISEKILCTTQTLLAESGQQRMRYEDIVALADVDPDGFVRLFPDERTLWSALLSRIHHRLTHLLEHAAAGSKTALDTLEHMFHSHVSFIARNPAIPKLLLQLSQSDDPRLQSRLPASSPIMNWDSPCS